MASYGSIPCKVSVLCKQTIPWKKVNMCKGKALKSKLLWKRLRGKKNLSLHLWIMPMLRYAILS